MAYEFACDRPDCDFLVCSSGEEEVLRLARAHVRDVHGEAATRADVADEIDEIEHVEVA